MAETIKGAGVFWGIGSTFSPSGSGVGTGTLNPQSVDRDVEAEKVVEVMDYKGETVAVVFANQIQNEKFTIIPTSTTIALAKSSSILPTPGTLVVIVDDPNAGGATTVNWVFIKGSVKRSNTDALKLDFELKKWGTDLSTTIAS